MPTKSFSYLEQDVAFLDTACQCMRPKGVIEAELGYYTNSNSCGGRVSYQWGKQVDFVLSKTRKQILDYLGKDSFNYTVIFTPNTTYGINLILQNLNPDIIKTVATTDKEHNSALLPAMSLAKSISKDFKMLSRNKENSINLDELKVIKEALLIFNTTSNLDGTAPVNLKELVNFAARQGHLVMLDATQSLVGQNIDWSKIEFDALFASGHKMYAPSGGFLVIKKNLISNLKQVWVGGGTVESVFKSGYKLITNPEEIHSRLELGLLNYSSIFGLSEAINWLQNYSIKEEYPEISYSDTDDREAKKGPSKEAKYYLESLSELLYSNMLELQKVGYIRLLNQKPSHILSFLPTKIGAYEMAKRLAFNNVYVRSGFMCCHYYIQEVLGSGPLVRVSLGLHNTPRDIARLLLAIEKNI